MPKDISPEALKLRALAIKNPEDIKLSAEEFSYFVDFLRKKTQFVHALTGLEAKYLLLSGILLRIAVASNLIPKREEIIFLVNIFDKFKLSDVFGGVKKVSYPFYAAPLDVLQDNMRHIMSMHNHFSTLRQKLTEAKAELLTATIKIPRLSLDTNDQPGIEIMAFNKPLAADPAEVTQLSAKISLVDSHIMRIDLFIDKCKTEFDAMWRKYLYSSRHNINLTDAEFIRFTLRCGILEHAVDYIKEDVIRSLISIINQMKNEQERNAILDATISFLHHPRAVNDQIQLLTAINAELAPPLKSRLMQNLIAYIKARTGVRLLFNQPVRSKLYDMRIAFVEARHIQAQIPKLCIEYQQRFGRALFGETSVPKLSEFVLICMPQDADTSARLRSLATIDFLNPYCVAVTKNEELQKLGDLAHDMADVAVLAQPLGTQFNLAIKSNFALTFDLGAIIHDPVTRTGYKFASFNCTLKYVDGTFDFSIVNPIRGIVEERVTTVDPRIIYNVLSARIKSEISIKSQGRFKAPTLVLIDRKRNTTDMTFKFATERAQQRRSATPANMHFADPAMVNDSPIRRVYTEPNLSTASKGFTPIQLP
jgi:hypothetical protein